MSRIAVTGKIDETFDDEELDASYRAEFIDVGGVAIYVDVYRGSELIAQVSVAHFAPDEADGFVQD